jgi:hypothetical protein
MSGQAMVEFAMVVGAFLLLLLGAVTASVYTVQRAAAVTAVAAGAQVAASGTPGAAGAARPDLAGALTVVARVVSPVLRGTRLRSLPPGRPCPELATVPRGQVDLCATTAGGMVTVRLRGTPADSISFPGLDWSLDLMAEVHVVTFEP